MGSGHHGSMPSDRASLEALKNILSEVDVILETTPPLPENRTARSRELLAAALHLADDLLKQQRTKAAVKLGSAGGKRTAERGADYFRNIAAMRKTKGGGRPKSKPSD